MKSFENCSFLLFEQLSSSGFFSSKVKGVETELLHEYHNS